jgi:hypothetical protein
MLYIKAFYLWADVNNAGVNLTDFIGIAVKYYEISKTGSSIHCFRGCRNNLCRYDKRRNEV